MKKLLVLLSFLLVFTLLFTSVPSMFAQTPDPELPYPGLLPDSPVYFLKSLRDRVKGLFIFGEANKTLYSLYLADKRLSEAKALSDKGEYDLAAITAQTAGKENETAQTHLANVESQGKDVTAIVARLAANSARQQAVLTKVLNKVPQQARAGILNAMEMSQKGLIKAQQMQTKQIGNPKTTGTPNGVGKPTNLPGGRP